MNNCSKFSLRHQAGALVLIASVMLGLTGCTHQTSSASDKNQFVTVKGAQF